MCAVLCLWTIDVVVAIIALIDVVVVVAYHRTRIEIEVQLEVGLRLIVFAALGPLRVDVFCHRHDNETFGCR